MHKYEQTLIAALTMPSSAYSLCLTGHRLSKDYGYVLFFCNFATETSMEGETGPPTEARD